MLGTILAMGRVGLSSVLANPVLRWVLIAGVCLLAFKWHTDRTYDSGFKAARAECVRTVESMAQKGRTAQAEASARVLAAAERRATEAEQSAEARERAADRAVEAARRNNRGVCLTQEVTDAIRAIPTE